MENENILDLIKNNKSVAMLAPTFALDFKYPAIIGMLKELGFDQVTELTFGAKMVNWVYADYVKNHPEQSVFISSPCPTLVAWIKTQYPELVKYLVPFVSPMVAMAKIFKKYHPDYKIIFISPCLAKKAIEAPKFKEFIDGVITLKELKDIFEKQNISEENFKDNYKFDFLVSEHTKIYPISGGLAASSHLHKLFGENEILVTEGFANFKVAFENIKSGNNQYKFLDLLTCPGGCIGGPAINNKNLSIEQKQQIIHDYIKISSQEIDVEHEEKVNQAHEIDLSFDYFKN